MKWNRVTHADRHPTLADGTAKREDGGGRNVKPTEWTLGDTIRTGVHLSPVRPSGSGDAPSSATGGTSPHSVRPSPWDGKGVPECRYRSNQVAASPIFPGHWSCVVTLSAHSESSPEAQRRRKHRPCSHLI